MIVNQWDTYSKLYNEGIGPKGDDLHKKYIDPLIFKYLGEYSNKIIIDAGCGNGYLLKKLSAKAKKVYGLDYSSNLIQNARENIKGLTNVETKIADLAIDWRIKSKSCNYVVANMLLQYLPVLDGFIKETARVLAYNGILIVIIDSPLHSLFARAQELLGKKDIKLFQLESYFAREKRQKRTLWNKAIIEYYHRPIMDYINAISPHFILREMDENSEDGEMPRILGMKWSKIG